MSTISDKVLSKIKKEKITPKPRWQFWLRDGGKWLAFLALMVTAIIAIGLLIFFWSDGPWLHGGHLGLGLLFGRMPILLIVLVLSGVILGLLDFKNTGRGYRYNLKATIPIIFLTIAVAGGVFYYMGMSKKLDSVIGQTPFYQNRQMYMMQVWQNPADGLIAGKITELINDSSFYLQDFDGKQWQVVAKDATWRHGLRPEINLEVKLIGSIKNGVFVADEVRPWMGPGGCGMTQGMGSCGMMR